MKYKSSNNVYTHCSVRGDGRHGGNMPAFQQARLAGGAEIEGGRRWLERRRGGGDLVARSGSMPSAALAAGARQEPFDLGCAVATCAGRGLRGRRV